MIPHTIATGATERIQCLITGSAGETLTGLTDVLLAIRRLSDGYSLDFNDSTFKASGWTSRTQTMSETSASLYPGQYYYDWDTSTIVSPVADDKYVFTITQTSGSALNVPQVGEAWIGHTVDSMYLIEKLLRNKLILSAGSSSNYVLYDDDNTTPLLTFSVTDKDGAAVTLAAGAPARRSRGT